MGGTRILAMVVAGVFGSMDAEKAENHAISERQFRSNSRKRNAPLGSGCRGIFLQRPSVAEPVGELVKARPGGHSWRRSAFACSGVIHLHAARARHRHQVTIRSVPSAVIEPWRRWSVIKEVRSSIITLLRCCSRRPRRRQLSPHESGRRRSGRWELSSWARCQSITGRSNLELYAGLTQESRWPLRRRGPAPPHRTAYAHRRMRLRSAHRLLSDSQSLRCSGHAYARREVPQGTEFGRPGPMVKHYHRRVRILLKADFPGANACSPSALVPWCGFE